MTLKWEKYFGFLVKLIHSQITIYIFKCKHEKEFFKIISFFLNFFPYLQIIVKI